jgi:hypothetical protein
VVNKGLASLVLVLVCAGACTGTVTLDLARDFVHLSDGRVIECTVILKGKDSVIVLVGEQEKTFPMSGVVRIERGVFSGERRTFETGPVDGHEVITPQGGGDGDVVEPVAPPAPPPKKPVRQTPPKKPAEKKPEKPTLPAAAPKQKADAGTQEKPKAGTTPVAPVKPKPGTDRPLPPKAKEKAEELIDQLEELKRRFQREDD